MAKRKAQRMLFEAMDTETKRPADGPADATEEVEPRPDAWPEETRLAEGVQPPPAPDLSGKTVWCVDAHGLIYQVFHALPEMSSPAGEPVGAVFGFVRDLFSILEEHRPDYLFVAFDMPGPTFRHALYEPYKANRPAMPADLSTQIARIRQILQIMEIPALGVLGYEADDILATLADVTEKAQARCVLVTNDKDCRQLITDRTTLFSIRKQSMFDRESLAADWGIEPGQVVDFQTLVGDTSDNVPGIPGIGAKTAGQLLQQYGTLDQVLANAEQITAKKRRENLIAGRETALTTRRLVQLERDVPVAVDWELGRCGGGDAASLKAIFRELGFRSLSDRVDRLFGAGPAAFHEGAQPPATAASAAASPPVVDATYHLVDTPEAFEAFLTELKRQDLISVDLETTSLWPRWADPVGYAFCWDAQNAWYLPVRAPEGEPRLDPETTLEALRPILEDPQVRKVGQNLKYDMIVLRSAGVRLAGLALDTMVAAYLLDAGRRNHNLDDLAQHYLGHTTTKYTDLVGKGKSQKRIDEVPARAVADYAGEDALLPLLLMPTLEARLREAELVSLWEELERPLIEVLVEMEATGVRVDTERLARLGREHAQLLERLKQEIYALAGREFNIASPKQLAQVLFEECNLPVLKKTATGFSTDADVLQDLAAMHPLPEKIIDYRQSSKLKSTYIDALPTMLCPKTGRIHASFNQVVTATGRLSSSDPNLQNIPVRTEEGRAIRSAFVAEGPDQVLLAADYSQIELRVLAHFTQDPNLCEAFANDEDIHTRVASEVFGVSPADVTKDQRRQAKAVNFGVIYGQSAFGLARQLRIGRSEAAAFIQAYFARYPGIQQFLDEVLEECRRRGYVTTILGRRRAIEGLPVRRSRQSTIAERTAINTVIQGSAADLIKRAMIRVAARLRNEPVAARMLLQIHDELIFEVGTDDRDRLARLVTEEMAEACRLRVPLKVDVKTGPNWGETEAIESLR